MTSAENETPRGVGCGVFASEPDRLSPIRPARLDSKARAFPERVGRAGRALKSIADRSGRGF